MPGPPREETTVDTIVAIATAPGRGGIGVVRLSGPAAREIVAPLLRLRHPLAQGRARFGEILDPTTGNTLDEAVVTFFAAPRSYTGEDVVEIAAHGSPVLLDFLLRECCLRGGRLAEPGEFTQWAFLSGRLDLAQAEAVDDLITSTTIEQTRLAARQLGGALANAVRPSKHGLIDLIAALEAGIDFAEDDIDLLPSREITAAITAAEAPLTALASSYSYGRVLREGLQIALVGRPNAGKSSLFNRLLQQDRAIVTASPGTTRDVIAERTSLSGVPVELLDTAGLRDSDSTGEAERLGIARSRETLADATLVLLVLDATLPLHPEDLAILCSAHPRTLLLVLNKTDLLPDHAECAALDHELANLHFSTLPVVVSVSALTGAGVDKLRTAILRTVTGGAIEDTSAIITNRRQHTALTETVAALTAARGAVAANLPHEMLLLDLYAALRSLDTLTGATTSDDVLRLIFSRFCIGK